MMLLIDSREPEHIVTMFPGAIVTTLQTGDILDLATGLMIERKTALDLLSSIGDGRLYDQCARMAELSKISVLLIHGSVWPEDKDGALKVNADGRSTGWNYWSVMMTLLSVQQGGVLVMTVPQQHFAEAVNKLRAWAAKPEHRQIRRAEPAGIWTKPDPQVELMALLAGGPAKAKLILDEYGTPGMALAYLDKWTEIAGVGPASVSLAKALLGQVPVIVPF